MKFMITILFASCLISCNKSTPADKSGMVQRDTNNTFGFYQPIESKMIYSKSVADSFRIFSSLPDDYVGDDTKKYPLILMVDANAYIEPVVAELKLGTLTQGYPKSIVVGVGYKNFWAMDSLRDRDYTYPKALAEDSFRLSGGADKFKRFIDEELLPQLQEKYRVDTQKIVLMGHSLGGYFVIYYMLNSFDKNHIVISNFIAASPSLSYYHRYLLQLGEKVDEKAALVHLKLYASVGTLEQDSLSKENDFRDFEFQLTKHHHRNLKFKFDEYSNFNHMDAAMPGFMKGLSYIFE